MTASVFLELLSPFEVRVRAEPAWRDSVSKEYQHGKLLACAPGAPDGSIPGDVVIVLEEAVGMVAFEWGNLSDSPELVPDGWEVIEEIGAHFVPGTRLLPFETYDDESVMDKLRPVEDLYRSLNGWHVVRVSVRGVDGVPDGGSVKVQIWPTDGPRGLHELVDTPKVSLRPPPVRDRTEAARATATSWRNLIEQLRDRGAPLVASTLSTGATEDQIQATEILSGVSWPSDLKAWFRTVNAHSENLFPEFDLLSLDESADARATMLAAHDWIPDTEDGNGRGNEPVYRFIPAFIPIAAGDGLMLVYDARPGPATGQVVEFDDVDSDDSTRRWDSLAALLDALAATLRGDSGWSVFATPPRGEPNWTLVESG
ncbi:SMI1/KNR4 family protein [Williamsia maris]|uniref:Cell wall assembly regulator SMI1 n=1 Tax=Williamsia maris TaxID=72806 RepID=A0ABT1HJK7_9NOCA|nr:SMI1/KNR4 family protein [Williamsia maris]MCP2178125.1 Cell wall assembly regulator SMI1 [Williamsia maris]